jgi:hypothetical protein
LARNIDRAETVLLIGLTVIWLVSLPLFATVASAEWMAVESRVLAEQSRDIAVDAVLNADAAPVELDSRSPAMGQPTVAATWVGRDGQPADAGRPTGAGGPDGSG